MHHRTFVGAVAVGWLLVQLLACGEDNTNGGGGAGAGAGGTTATGGQGGGSITMSDYCEGRIAHDTDCGTAGSTLEECLADPETACIFDAVRPALWDELLACLRDRPCGEGDDQCFYETGMAAPAAGQDDYLAACSTKYDECQAATGFRDDWCTVTLATSAHYEQMTSCLELACDQVDDCLDGTMPAACQ